MDVNFPRLFTVNEANGLLPVLRPLVEQILENIRRLKGVSETVIRREQLDPDAPNLMERLREDDEVLKLVTQIKDWVTTINGHGCVCKGVEQGLIDFPCMLGAEVVFLCWQIGEANVAHYHRIEDGFAGRKTLLDGGNAEPDSKISYH
ncbi:MAG TPA: DUF2203 domain-containing protein [Candidatus Limnocylindria bacterium]|nr:DUF2203 domain-containing protein [Candidatus Limnocylindria bacterium]